MKQYLKRLSLAVVLLWAGQAAGENLAPKVQRPKAESWSDGPTLYWKHKVSAATPQNLRSTYNRSRLRLKALSWGTRQTIPINEDMKNHLAGYGGRAGAITELKGRIGNSGSSRPFGAFRESRNSTSTRRTKDKQLVSDAMASRQRVTDLLQRHSITRDQQNLLAELMVWRGLAYNSSTLAHGSFGPSDAGNLELQQKARDGLNAAIGASFKLGRRLSKAVAGQERFLRWDDIWRLQAEAIKDFPDKEPGQVRHVNFSWPANTFGVHHSNLHGDKGQVHRFHLYLNKDRAKGFSKSPLAFMARTLYWLHNVHPFRDGNGRTEVLLNWSMAKAAGFPLPLDYDQGSGRFKLSATKWGGARSDLRRFIARGALGTERFVGKLLPLLQGDKIISSHTDHGAVSMVTKSGDGQRHLLVMLPVTHAHASDSDLAAEKAKNRVVLSGSTFDPQAAIRIQIAINGKHNAWKTITPAAVHRWDSRYPWWTTVEPIFKVPLPSDASYANFKVVGADGQPINAKDYYMNLREYQDINSRIGGQS